VNQPNEAIFVSSQKDGVWGVFWGGGEARQKHPTSPLFIEMIPIFQ
jgi:hypothetical protein